MKIIKKSNEIKTILKKYQSYGFVPTMGALHEGHKSLIHKCKKQNKITVVSIFLNPKQFTNKEDLRKYPSNIKKDISIWFLNFLRALICKSITFFPCKIVSFFIF